MANTQDNEMVEVYGSAAPRPAGSMAAAAMLHRVGMMGRR
jgi:hypothetical protein